MTQPIGITKLKLNWSYNREKIRERFDKLIIDIDKRRETINRWEKSDFFEEEEENCHIVIQQFVDNLHEANKRLIAIRNDYFSILEEDDKAPKTINELQDYLDSLQTQQEK